MDTVWPALLGPLGTLVLALLVIGAFLKGYIVPGWTYRAIARERDRLFDIAVPLAKGVERVAPVLPQPSHQGLSE